MILKNVPLQKTREIYKTHSKAEYAYAGPRYDHLVHARSERKTIR